VRLSVDTAPVIYSVQQVAPFAPKVDARLATPSLSIVTSDLTRVECLGFTEATFRCAAEIRAKLSFRTPDALHLAVALEGGCTAFYTNDARLSRFPDLTVELVC
jgi:uncharacterized protein